MSLRACSSSAYIVIGNKIVTRPLSNSILPGIRRRTLLELAEKTGIEIEERLFTVEESAGSGRGVHQQRDDYGAWRC